MLGGLVLWLFKNRIVALKGLYGRISRIGGVALKVLLKKKIGSVRDTLAWGHYRIRDMEN